MTTHAFIRCISGDRQIAGTLAIAAPGALYAVDFSTPEPKTRNRSFFRLRRETALRVRRLTKSEDEETIIINRSGRSTYPEEKSVLTSGATPQLQRLGRWRKFVKGVAYPWYCRRLVQLIAEAKPDVLHYQWMPLLPVDLYFMRQIRRCSPITSIVVTVHSVQPLATVAVQRHSERALDLANGVVVHGQESKAQLLRKFPALNPNQGGRHPSRAPAHNGCTRRCEWPAP